MHGNQWRKSWGEQRADPPKVLTGPVYSRLMTAPKFKQLWGTTLSQELVKPLKQVINVKLTKKECVESSSVAWAYLGEVTGSTPLKMNV